MTHTLKAILSAVVLTAAFTLTSPVHAQEKEPSIQEAFYQEMRFFQELQTDDMVAFAPHDPDSGDLYWCYGWDDVVNTCQLYLGSQRDCDHLEPCIQQFKEVASSDTLQNPDRKAAKCEHKVFGCCWDSFPVVCDSLTAK